MSPNNLNMQRWVVCDFTVAEKLEMLELAAARFSEHCCGDAMQAGELSLHDCIRRLEIYKAIADDYRAELRAHSRD